LGVQSTISCGDNVGATAPEWMAQADSMDSVAENAQQDPQLP